MKKFIALLLCFAMLLALAACTGSEKATEPAEESAAPAAEAENTTAPATDAAEAEETEEPAVVEDVLSIFPLEETLTITCWDTWPPFFGTFDGNFTTPADTYRFKEMESRLNVHLELTVESTETASEKFNLMVAAGDYCDLIYAVSSNYVGGIDQAIEDDVIYDLMPFMKEGKMPHYAEAIALDSSLQVDLLSENGALGGWASILRDGQVRKSGSLIRQDWLDDLGLEVPTTVGELKDVLIAFRDQKGATDALWTCNSNNGEVSAIKTAFEPMGIYVNDEGKVVYGLDTMKDYYEYMNSLWEEGLIPEDFLSYVESHKPLNSLVDKGLCGVIEDDYDTYMLGYQAVNDDPNCVFTAMPDLVREEGDQIEYYSKLVSYEGTEYASLSTDCDPEIIDIVLAYMDYNYCEEGYILANYGVEGITFEYDDNGSPVFTDLIVNNELGIPVALANMIYITGCFPHLRDAVKLDYALSDAERACPAIWDSQRAEESKAMPNAVTLNTEEQYESATLMTDVTTYMEESYLNFLTGARSIDDYDNWVAELESSFGSNIDRICEIYQGAYDRYLEKAASVE